MTRRLAHEMTHAVHPSETRTRLLELADEVESFSDDNANDVALELRRLAGVGWPPRGIQYTATAPVLIRQKNLANNEFSRFDPPLEVAPEHRGLTPPLVDALARVRTDLDSFSSNLIDLLIAQAYFLTDANVRLAMPELIPVSTPMWDWAIRKVADANANETSVVAELKEEAKRKYILKR